MAIFLIGFQNATFPSDLSGTKLALAGRITEAEVEAIGGVPVRMPFGERYAALQAGMLAMAGIVGGWYGIGLFRYAIGWCGDVWLIQRRVNADGRVVWFEDARTARRRCWICH